MARLFFFFLRTIDATTKRMRFPELHPIESNPHVSPPTPLHMLNGWQFCGNRLPRGFLGCVFAGPLPSSNDPFFRRRQSHPTHMLLDHRTEISPLSTFKYVVTGDRLLNISRTTTLRKQGPNARRQLPGCVRSQSQISKEKKNGTSSNSALQSERVGLGDV